MGPPPPVIASPSPQPNGEKSDRNTTPRQEETEPRDTPPKSKTVLVPQTKLLTVMEKEGNVFRCFKTRKYTILLTFDRWLPAICEQFLLHAHHSSRANTELNDMIEHYERLLLDREQDIDAWKGKFSSLESDLRTSSDTKLKLEDQVDHLSSKLMKSNGELQDQYQRYDKLQEELSTAQGRLSESKSNAYDLTNQLTKLQAKYNATTKFRDDELAKSASKAIREVKSRGMELIQGAILFIQTEKATSELESDRSELEAALKEKRTCLDALPTSSFNPQHFEEFFTESPPLSESGLDWDGSSEPTEPEVLPTPIKTTELVTTLPEVPSSVNNETMVIPDDKNEYGPESGASTEQPLADEPTEPEHASIDPTNP
ncbi:hypothetical protein AtEden1_Chr2g0228571 [Arabidopsis thaliana]